jgi:isoquinoline 1-oxidoreductase beta subunit
MIAFEVNGRGVRFEGAPDTPLLWILRDTLGLKGTKYGCGVGACGICVVLVDGQPKSACMEEASSLSGKQVVTIEGITREPQHPVIQAWIAEQVPQCGYCQPGQVVAAAWLLQQHPEPSDAQIDDAMSHVLCRCGTYPRVRRAVQRAADILASNADPPVRSGAVLVTETGRPGLSQRTESGPGLDAQGRFAPNPWVRIARDGMVTVIVDRSEMGQGVVTSLATLVAEELEVGLHQVQVEFAPAAKEYVNPLLGEQMTGGSTSVRSAWTRLRQAGAVAREMLVSAAAKKWNVKHGECHARQGQVRHASSGRELGFGALVETAARLPPPKTAHLKGSGEFRLIGQSLQRLEVPDMVIGRAKYSIDVALPGMLYAVVLRCPELGGSVARFDGSAAGQSDGVHAVLEIQSGIAVVAESSYAALRARDKLQVEWAPGLHATLDSAQIRERLLGALERRGSVARDEGDAGRALKRSGRVFEAVYETPYLAHATMEPMNCVAHVTADGCDVWVGTQAQQGAQATAMEITGLPQSQVRVHSTFLGGGFGRRLEHDFVAETVEIAKAIRRPVQVLWTRSDDMQHDFYRPANIAACKAALDASGRPIAWLHRVAGPPLALDGIDVPYAITHLHEVHIEEDPGIPTGPWRSVGASQNAFAIESFVDELAWQAHEDPLAFRLALLTKSPRHRAVLELAAAKSDWGSPLREGRGRGIAVYQSFGSWVAQVAEVSLLPDGALRVHRVVCAIDCGSVINPDTVASQLEGAVIFGLSAALYGRITIRDGAVEQRSFEDYRILTLRDSPEIEIHILPSRRAPGGVGEPGVPPIAPAIANALFAATSTRIRSLPLAPALLLRRAAAAVR